MSIIFTIDTARDQAIFLFIHCTKAIMSPDSAQHCCRLVGPNGEPDHGVPHPLNSLPSLEAEEQYIST